MSEQFLFRYFGKNITVVYDFKNPDVMFSIFFFNRKCWLTILPTSTKHLSRQICEHKNIMTYDIGNMFCLLDMYHGSLNVFFYLHC